LAVFGKQVPIPLAHVTLVTHHFIDFVLFDAVAGQVAGKRMAKDVITRSTFHLLRRSVTAAKASRDALSSSGCMQFLHNKK